MRYLITAFAAVCTLALACKKDEPTQQNNTALITRADWKYDDAGADADRNGSIDQSITSSFPACLIDNTLTLSTGGTGSVNEGTVKCDPAAPNSVPLSWSLSNNESVLNLGGGGLLGISGQFRILVLNENTLTLSKDTTFQGFPVAMVLRLKH